MKCETQKYVFGVDQSISKTAWTFVDQTNNLLNFGVIKTSPKDGSLYDRITYILDGLQVVADELSEKTYREGEDSGIPACFILAREGLSFSSNNSNSSRDLAQLVGALEERFSCAFEEVPPKALKKYATGNGNADKQMMVDALPEDVRSRFQNANFKKTTGLQDLADSYFISTYFMEKYIHGN